MIMTNRKSLELSIKYKKAPILYADFQRPTKSSKLDQLLGWRTTEDGIRVYHGYITNRSAN